MTFIVNRAFCVLERLGLVPNQPFSLAENVAVGVSPCRSVSAARALMGAAPSAPRLTATFPQRSSSDSSSWTPTLATAKSPALRSNFTYAPPHGRRDTGTETSVTISADPSCVVYASTMNSVRRNAANPLQTRDRDLGVQRQQSCGPVSRRIRMGQASSQGPAIADLDIRGHVCRIRHDRQVFPHDGRFGDLGMPAEGPENEAVARIPESGQ